VAATHILAVCGLVSLVGFSIDGAGFSAQLGTLVSDQLQGDLLCYWVIFGIAFAIDSYKAAQARRVEIPTQQPTAVDRRSAPPVHIPVKNNGRITLVEMEDVDWFEADDNYVRVHTGERSHLVREKIGRLESQLDGSRFLRIHRSIIVNTTRIHELRPMPGGVYDVVLKDGKVVRSGRKFKEHVVSLLGQ
jgi:two-component system LytT family response regulator